MNPYSEILDNVIEYNKNITIISGIFDITKDEEQWSSKSGKLIKTIKNFSKDSYWVILGNGNHDMISESISELICEVDIEGEYQIWVVFTYCGGEYDNEGHCTMRGYLEIEHVKYELIQTIEQRNRELKLNKLLLF